MARLPWSYVLADRIAGIDYEIIQLTQETVYFFIVIFIIELHFLDNRVLTVCLAAVLFLCSAVRYLHFAASFYMRWCLRYLSSTAKIHLLAAHEKRSENEIRMILEELGLQSAKQVASRVFRETRTRVERLAGL